MLACWQGVHCMHTAVSVPCLWDSWLNHQVAKIQWQAKPGRLRPFLQTLDKASNYLPQEETTTHEMDKFTEVQVPEYSSHGPQDVIQQQQELWDAQRSSPWWLKSSNVRCTSSWSCPAPSRPVTALQHAVHAGTAVMLRPLVLAPF